jgi:hypothetical protein
MKIIDVHCHVFSEDVLTFGGKLLIAFSDVITGKCQQKCRDF